MEGRPHGSKTKSIGRERNGVRASLCTVHASRAEKLVAQVFVKGKLCGSSRNKIRAASFDGINTSLEDQKILDEINADSRGALGVPEFTRSLSSWRFDPSEIRSDRIFDRIGKATVRSSITQ